jgi:hypothetical protein
VAINRFPLDPLNEEAWDIRLELDEIVGLEPNVEVEGPTDLESARVGLSARPVHAGTLCALAPEQLKEMLADGDLEERTRQYLERELAASIAYRENCRRWDEEFSGFIDEDRARLFLALRQGKLVAEGIKMPESTHEDSLISLDQSARGFREWVSIPPDFWRSNKINWAKSRAAGRDGAFALIQVQTTELFACFPPPPSPLPPSSALRLRRLPSNKRLMSRRLAWGGHPLTGIPFMLKSPCGFIRGMGFPQSKRH